LAPLYFPDIKGVDIDFILAQGFSPFLISVAWSIDGQTLFAGGNVNKQGQFFIRRWTNAGKGSFEDWPVAGSYIRDLVPLANGKLAFSTISPASWGVLNLSGERVFFHGPAVADFRDDQGGLKLSADGMQVHFGFEAAGKSSAVFDIAKRTYIPENTPNLLPPLLSTPGISITDWNYTFKPKLNGVTLKLWQPMDRATSLAILPSGGGFVLGSWFGLQVADKLGNLRWFKPIPVHVLSVNTSADGRLVVAALGDGTIHWYRATDGIEQLVLYPHPDKKRWVMWTPEGYYDASAEGEDLIGWQLNQGNDKEARFIPNGQLYDVFFRPDIVQAKLRGDDISGLISITAAEALKKPPPNVGFTKIPISSKNIKDLAFPRFSRHVRMLTMNRRELHETNEIYSRVQNRGCQTSYRKRSFSCRCC
jgi:hypothetical protein